MILEPIIKSKLLKFKKDFLLTNQQDESSIFERFVNYNILSQCQPNILDKDQQLMDLICVGGFDDLGIDGIAILINGQLIKEKSDIDDILAKSKTAVFEYIFIQSKFKESFTQTEYLKFLNGVQEFLNEKSNLPMNDSVKYWKDIKDYIDSEQVSVKCLKSPSVKLYYVAIGKWQNDEHITGSFETFKNTLKNNFITDIHCYFKDGNELNKIINENENFYTSTINTLDAVELPEVKSVFKSYIVLCHANELLKLLKTDDGMLRRNIFEDNVRDFQGQTSINKDIYSTILNNPSSFMLLNNGITIVCDELNAGNRKITIVNPQIVNGCQTCNVIFSAYENKENIGDVTLAVKIISTTSSEIMNEIVRGTNRQNIVYDEAFEITSDFHRNLEQLFISMHGVYKNSLYYERRSHQYDRIQSVLPNQKINLRILIQSFISLFFNKPEEGHRHESKLLLKYKNQIFKDKQSLYPYFTSAYIYSKIENQYRQNKQSYFFYTYKMHIMLIIKELLQGNKTPDINNDKECEKYCKFILENIDNDQKFLDIFNKAEHSFSKAKKLWVNQKGGNFKYAVKDNSEFTKFLLHILSEENSEIDIEDKKSYPRGKIVKVGKDKNSKFYAFIECYPNEDLFVHEAYNKNLNTTFEGKDVLYTFDDKNNVVILKVLGNESEN